MVDRIGLEILSCYSELNEIFNLVHYMIALNKYVISQIKRIKFKKKTIIVVGSVVNSIKAGQVSNEVL